MPTKPVPDILPESIDDAELANALRTFSGAIGETVRFGTHVLKWCADKATAGVEQAPLLLSFRYAIELLDSISILVEQSSIDPCGVLLRALVEILLNTQYMLQADTKRRAMSFLVCHRHQKLRWYRKLCPTAQEGKQFEAQVTKDRVAGKMRIPRPPKLEQRIANLQALLNRPAYLAAEAEYQRLRSAGTHKPRWYSLFGGPKKLEQLAHKVGLTAVYQVVYRILSGLTHGTDIIQGKISPGGIHQIRLPRDAQTVTQNAMTFAFELYRSFIRYYVPERERDFDDWYFREVRTIYTALSGRQIIHVV